MLLCSERSPTAPRINRLVVIEVGIPLSNHNDVLVAKWQGNNSNQPLDSLDAAGWASKPTTKTAHHSNKLEP
jgi:hypothetical protein